MDEMVTQENRDAMDEMVIQGSRVRVETQESRVHEVKQGEMEHKV